MSFVYEQQTIIKLYKQALQNARKSEKSLRQVQRKLNAQLITCPSKTDNEYRQCIKANRSLFELEALRCEKSLPTAEKVAVVASGSTRTANGQNMKRRNDDHLIRLKNPSNIESKIPKLCKPVNNTVVKQRIANRSAKSFLSFPKAVQGGHSAGKLFTAPKTDGEQSLQSQRRAGNKEQISKRCSESVNRKYPSKGIIEIPMQYKPGKKYRTAQKPVSAGCNTDAIKNATVKKNNVKNKNIGKKDNNNNDVIVIEDDDDNQAIVKVDNNNDTAIVTGNNDCNKNECKQSLFCAADHCYTKCIDSVTSETCGDTKTSTHLGKVYDTGTLNSQMELKIEGNKLINCLLQDFSETALKRKRDEDSTECSSSLPQNPFYDFEVPIKKARLEHVQICDQPKAGCYSEVISNGFTDCKQQTTQPHCNGVVDYKVTQQITQSRSQIPRPIQNQEAPVPIKKARLEHVQICDQPKAGCYYEIISNGFIDCKQQTTQPHCNGVVDYKVTQQITQSRFQIPRPIQNQEAPVVFDVISHLKGMINDAL